MSRSLLVGLVLALGCSPAIAHETLPANWCPVGTQPVVVGQFSFTQAQLVEHRATQAPLLAMSADCAEKTCGIVDEWYWAYDKSTEFCGGVGLRGTTAEDAVAFVESPGSFNHRYHHTQYRFDQGPLSGVCVVCRVPPIGAVAPPRTKD